MSVWDGLAFEIEAYNRMVPTEDRREGISPSTKSASRTSGAAEE